MKTNLLRGGVAAMALLSLGAFQMAAAAALDCNTIYAAVGTNPARAGVGSYLTTLSTGGVLGNAVQLPASADQTSTTNGGVRGRSVTAGFGVDPVNKRIYYVDGYGGTGYNTARYARLYDYDGDTFTQLTVDASGAPVFSNPTTEHQAGVDEAGTLWATDWAAPSDIYQYSRGTVTRYLNAIAAPAVAADATEWNSLQDGDMAFDGVFDGVGQGRMWFVSSTTTNIVIYMVTRTSATAFQAKKVASFAPTAGALSATTNWVTGAAFGPDGLLYISTSGSDLYKYNTVAGTLTVAKDGVTPVNGQNAITDLGSCYYPKPALSVSKTHTGNFEVWKQGTYTIKVTNNGQFATSSAIVLKDALPNGMTYAGASSSTGTVSGPTPGTAGTISLTFTPTSPLIPQQSHEITLTVNVNLAARGNVTNYVSVGGGGDPGPNKNGTAPEPGSSCTSGAYCSSDPTTVLPPQTATITKSFTPASVPLDVASTITFTVTNPNTGGALTNLKFTDTLTGMSVANTTLGGTCASVTNASALTVGATALDLTIPSLAANSNCTITVQVKGTRIGVNPNTTSGVTSTQTPTPGTVSNTANLTVRPLAAGVSKSFNSPNVPQGGTTQLTITVTNPNGADATAFALTDDVAGTMGITGLTITAVSSDTCKGSGTVTTASGKYVLTGGTLPAAGCSVVLTVQVPTSATTGSKTNTIVGTSVTGTINSQALPAATNATASFTVTAPVITPNLTLTKKGPAFARPSTAANSNPAAGPVVAAQDSFISYTLTVNTAGANATGTTTVTDTLPPGLSWTVATGGTPNYTATPGTWTCSIVAQTITCTTTSPIEVGKPQTITLNNVKVAAGAAAGPTITNKATVSNPGETKTDDNGAEFVTRLVLTEVTKQVRTLPGGTFGTAASIRPGDLLEYCIDTQNRGGADLLNYVLSDALNSNGTSVTAVPIASDAAYGGRAIKRTRTPASGPPITDNLTAAADADAGRLTDSTLTVTLGTLLAGETVRTCFQVRVK
ncbi:DUF7933 domain-containing protein [Deinococcus terrestris]|uniref:DUF7933 domain-containing protein n=1 Tax=Deinococcus terrestris TaxID=2651870 RepID=UPI00188401A4|nr:DUF11 domain-containing protein [Deinococcus terrestris]